MISARNVLIQIARSSVYITHAIYRNTSHGFCCKIFRIALLVGVAQQEQQ